MRANCKNCGAVFEDQYRFTFCPHDAFPANDGNNNFKVHNDAYFYLATERMETQLKAAGWEQRLPGSHVWRAPSGAMFRGPAHSWQMMKRHPSLNVKQEERINK